MYDGYILFVTKANLCSYKQQIIYNVFSRIIARLLIQRTPEYFLFVKLVAYEFLIKELWRPKRFAA